MRLAVIPARGGSKRIPRKNVRPFAGRPMIAHAIGTALDSGLFDRVVVSTDDAAIASIAREHGAQVPFLRPAGLADDHAPTVPVIAHAADACGARDDDEVCCVYPCVPLLRAEDLAEGLELLREAGGAGYAFPVVAFPAPVQRALRRSSDGRVAPLQPEHVNTRSQDLEPAFHDAGQCYWARAATWRAGLPIHAHGRAFVMPAWRTVDIDLPDDWARAEALYEALAARERA
jgi:pseudaminic acid cytidylyltransferase